MPHSLHRRLLAWLLVPLLFMSAAHLASTYVDTKKTSEEIFDKLLLTLALSISAHALASAGDLPTDELLELIRSTTNDDLYYKVIGPDNSFIMGYDDMPEPPGGIRHQNEHLQIYDAEYWDEPVRIIAVSRLVNDSDYSGWMTTFVAQTLNDRRAYVSNALIDNSLRILLMIVVTSLLLSLGVVIGLRSLRHLATAVHNRHPQDLSPIDDQKLPREIQGVVNALNNLIQRLGQHINLTEQFVENAAHQLRTPVTALLPQSELALRHAESERERTAVSKIYRSARNIARLSNQLLNLTRAQAIQIDDSDFKQLDLARVCKQQVRVSRENHAEAKFELDLQTAGIMGIDFFLCEVIDNLLDNALKYGGSDKTIHLKTYTDNNVKAILEVADHGPGIAVSDRQRVLERFVRVDTEASGSGLGLAIVSQIVEGHRGELEISDSPETGGCLIRCVFPCS